MAKTRLGFDLGSSSMKIAVIRPGGPVRLEEVRLPENLMDGSGTIALPHVFTQFLRQTRKELSLPRVPAALVLPPSQVICRLVTMPRMTTGQLEMNLPYEFSDFIHGVADQYHCDYALCQPSRQEEEENGVPMMAAAAAKSTLAGYHKMFSQAGIRLKTVLPQEMALIQLTRAEEKEFCFVDLGHQATRITVVWRDRVQATRQIALGGRSLDMAVADELGVDAFLAGTYKMENYHEIQSSPAVAELCERIAVEILKVVNFYQFTYRSSDLNTVCLVGGGAALPALRQAIVDVVGLELLAPEDLLPAAGQGAAAGIFAAGAALGGQT
jgi:type IV pilus assembly protein PilM